MRPSSVHSDESFDPSISPPASNGFESRRVLASYLIVVFLLAVLPYLNTLLNGFVYDDNTQVLSNPYILNFHHLRGIFTTTVWSYVGKEGLTNYYRPLMTVGYLFCHELFGMLAYGYHLMNVLLYAGCCLLLFGVTARLFRRHDLAFLAAALFALHPVHTEDVAWIAGITGLELAFFYLLAFWFFLRLPKAGGGHSGVAMLGMVMSFLLALLSKEQAMTFPALATFYEYTCREDRHQISWSGKLARYGPLWLLLGAYLFFRVNVLGGIAPVVQFARLTWGTAILSAVVLVGQYVGKLFWPVRLCAFYVFHPSLSLTDPRFLAGCCVLAGGLALFVLAWRRARLLSFALLWFIVTLAPVLNARWMAANVFTERYLALPSVGFCWLLAWAGIAAWDRAALSRFRLRPVLAAAACAVALAFGFRIVTRNRDWRDDIALYTKTLAQSPGAAAIYNNLGTVYWRRGRSEDARRCWEQALALRPDKDIFLNNMGLYYTRKKQYAEAESYYQRATRARPDYTDAHLNLGSLLRKEGKWPQAKLQLQAAIALSPLNPAAHNEMAKLDLAMDRPSEAAAEFQRSLDASPTITALNGLAQIDIEAGRTGQARRQFERAVEMNAYDSRAQFGLAALDASSGRLDKALAEYRAGLQSDPQNALARSAVEKLKLSLDHDRSSPH